MIDLLLKNVVLNNTVCDVAVKNGVFSAIEKEIAQHAVKVIDGKGVAKDLTCVILEDRTVVVPVTEMCQ